MIKSVTLEKTLSNPMKEAQIISESGIYIVPSEFGSIISMPTVQSVEPIEANCEVTIWKTDRFSYTIGAWVAARSEITVKSVINYETDAKSTFYITIGSAVGCSAENTTVLEGNNVEIPITIKKFYTTPISATITGTYSDYSFSSDYTKLIINNVISNLYIALTATKEKAETHIESDSIQGTDLDADIVSSIGTTKTFSIRTTLQAQRFEEFEIETDESGNVKNPIALGEIKHSSSSSKIDNVRDLQVISWKSDGEIIIHFTCDTKAERLGVDINLDIFYTVNPFIELSFYGKTTSTYGGQYELARTHYYKDVFVDKIIKVELIKDFIGNISSIGNSDYLMHANYSDFHIKSTDKESTDVSCKIKVVYHTNKIEEYKFNSIPIIKGVCTPTNEGEYNRFYAYNTFNNLLNNFQINSTNNIKLGNKLYSTANTSSQYWIKNNSIVTPYSYLDISNGYIPIKLIKQGSTPGKITAELDNNSNYIRNMSSTATKIFFQASDDPSRDATKVVSCGNGVWIKKVNDIIQIDSNGSIKEFGINDFSDLGYVPNVIGCIICGGGAGGASDPHSTPKDWKGCGGGGAATALIMLDLSNEREFQISVGKGGTGHPTTITESWNPSAANGNPTTISTKAKTALNFVTVLECGGGLSFTGTHTIKTIKIGEYEYEQDFPMNGGKLTMKVSKTGDNLWNSYGIAVVGSVDGGSGSYNYCSVTHDPQRLGLAPGFKPDNIKKETFGNIESSIITQAGGALSPHWSILQAGGNGGGGLANGGNGGDWVDATGYDTPTVGIFGGGGGAGANATDIWSHEDQWSKNGGYGFVALLY